MSLAIFLDHASLTPTPPEDDAHLTWQPVFFTKGLGVFRDSKSDYHIVSDHPEHLLLSIYPLLDHDRDHLKRMMKSRQSIDSMFTYADFNLVYPYCLVVVDKLHRVVTFKNDDFGIARFYLYDGRSRVILSNCLTPIIRGSPYMMTVNYKAVRMFGAIGWFPGCTTPIEQISQLPPGTKVNLSFGHGFPSIVSFTSNPYSCFFDLILSHKSCELMEAAVDFMNDLIRRLAMESKRPIKAGLSGGKDSRFIAALILSGKYPVEFITTNYFSEETDRVRKLLALRAGDRTFLKIREPQGSPSAEEAPKLIGALVSLTDGMFEVSRVGKPVSAKWGGDFRLSGLGGELTHGFYYPRDIAKADLRAVSKRIQRCVVDNEELVKRGTRGDVAKSVKDVEKQWLERCEKYGSSMDDLKFADFFFLSERLRRKSNLGLTLGLIAPMVSLYFVAYSFHLAGEEARRAAIQRNFVRDFDPKWAEQGYVSLEEGVHADRLTKREHSLHLFELCEDTLLVRSIWGRGWRQHVLKLRKSASFRANRLIKTVIAVNSIARHFESLCSKGQRRPASFWRSGMDWFAGRDMQTGGR